MEQILGRRSCHFAESSAAPTLGRDFVSVALADWGVQNEFRDVALVTSELVTNAVRHVGGSVTLAIVLVTGRVRIEVADTSRRPVPDPRDANANLDSGWGLRIVDQLATRWGSELREDGKIVWCELAESEDP